jgi:hypothetical protein
LGPLILNAIGGPSSIQRGIANYATSVLVWLPSVYGYAWLRHHVGHVIAYVFAAVTLVVVWQAVIRLLRATYQHLAQRYLDESDE